ncbi:type I restriction enzyme HsdR N-terminal domain-containing protein [Desulfonatronospira sp.]|uniref:type I restriction enzyme HsdR N-terminal domain-containing protein n=1 Tax=Desulfonatronospira sp. TaxID=1962951 RepID=UPI0025BC7AEB|nr:type I restriction enzyme HsdR N-terminal domain-containing protein [Desulfonatronospira sp.]
MHEVSFDQVIQDYLTGEDLQMTTYEDIRQALARILVEEKGYPQENIVPRYKLFLGLDDVDYSVKLDFVVMLKGQPVLILGFCPGAVSTYITQYVSAARIFPGGPVPFVLVTDSRDASLVRVGDKKEICRGYHCIPSWIHLQEILKECPAFTITPERQNKEKRVAYAMFALSDGYCSSRCDITTDKSPEGS